MSKTWPDPVQAGNYHMRVIGHERVETQARSVLRVARGPWGDEERLGRALEEVKRQYLCKVPDTEGYDPRMDDEPEYDNDFVDYDSATPHEDAKNPNHGW